MQMLKHLTVSNDLMATTEEQHQAKATIMKSEKEYIKCIRKESVRRVFSVSFALIRSG